ncbi:MAG: GntR family transcriptional regulator [Alphaproteobacteria bacterium]|nr:GntR family transcriptional regulator [Alphaproteobacteria bacterium]
MTTNASPPQRTSIQDSVIERLRLLAERSLPGTRLPTVRKLIAEFGVSQHIVQGAFEALRREGLISSHVGRGTFVSGGPGPAPQARSVLTLLYQHPYQRGDVIARIIHQRLSIDGHESLVLTYSNAAHVMEILKSGARYDAAIVQPRSSVVSVSLLALLKQRAEHVLIEGLALEHLDVDAVSNDPAKTVELIVDHLFAKGHRRIAWITEAGGNYFFLRTASFFRASCRGAGLSEEDCPVIVAETDPDKLGLRDLAGVVGQLKGKGKRLPFTALVVASFVDGRTTIDALKRCDLSTPDDVAVVRLGTPDLDSDHVGLITTAGRPSTRAAETVLKRLGWRWANRSAPWLTYYDSPELAVLASSAKAAPKTR